MSSNGHMNDYCLFPSREEFLKSGLVNAATPQILVAEEQCDHCWDDIDTSENEKWQGTIVIPHCCFQRHLYKVYHRPCMAEYLDQTVKGYCQEVCPNPQCRQRLFPRTKAKRSNSMAISQSLGSSRRTSEGAVKKPSFFRRLSQTLGLSKSKKEVQVDYGGVIIDDESPRPDFFMISITDPVQVVRDAMKKVTIPAFVGGNLTVQMEHDLVNAITLNENQIVESSQWRQLLLQMTLSRLERARKEHPNAHHPEDARPGEVLIWARKIARGIEAHCEARSSAVDSGSEASPASSSNTSDDERRPRRYPPD
ncbi:uncharacterized protein K452DRAFT_312038 [Aplosporella prunicola CBS 121167]|uniref:Uncharacterized protein n=1 Tax=Aplosporella prunicola CBS 121167 TaxID=1176127 RepID=A0A6A6B2T9_9PEZI|nr:uncharacterized protein K452DRAFT_312038 [Aplosporella prunicola CBS 121167]KAF2137908.1 hypothetical protein K452DRAFT_312038 [Aplosporella prunicola CBS 121167]